MRKENRKSKNEKAKKVCLLILVLAIALLTGCNAKTEQETISEAVGVDCSEGEVVVSEDTHGGFHGDGETYIVLNFPNGELEEEIKQNPNWNPFPLSLTMTKIVYGYEETTEYGVLSWRSCFLDDSDPLSSPKPRIPEIQNGYYYFEDRNDESNDKWDDTETLYRSSRNFTIAVYDADTHMLYYGEDDT